jgi:hypothetical protein
MNRNAVSFLLFIVAIDSILYSVAKSGLLGTAAPTYVSMTLVFLTFNTCVIYFLLQSVKKTEPELFIRHYRTSISMKLMTSCFYILVVVLADLPHANANATFFLIAYILQTATEVGFLFRKVNE